MLSIRIMNESLDTGVAAMHNNPLNIIIDPKLESDTDGLDDGPEDGLDDGPEDGLDDGPEDGPDDPDDINDDGNNLLLG